tara:strand:- start:944 stop:2719 length:1776 start_codon:yes stop_codon:yes gene_type:complete
MAKFSKYKVFSKLMVFPLIFLICGCAGVSNSVTPVKQEIAHDSKQSLVNSYQQENQKIVSERPEIELSKDILFKIMVAEIAGHRGKIDLTTKHYLDLAKITLDPVIIERATRIAVYARNDEASYQAAKLWVEIEPKNPDPHQVLTVMHLRKNNLDEALRHLEIILEVSGGDFDQKLWMVANFLGSENDKNMVVKLMERLMANHMNDPDALYAYAHVSSRIGDIERAESLFERVLELRPDNETAAMAYLYLLKSNGNITKALNWLEVALKDDDESFNLRMTYARLLTDSKRFDEARAQFELLYNKKPDNTDLIYALGLLSLQQNQSSEAKKYFENLLELKEYVFDANYYLGRIAEEENQLDKANNFYINVQGGDNYYDALIRISLIFSKQGKIEKALTYIRSIEEPKDANRNILIQAEAEILIAEERFEEALGLFNKAIKEKSHPDLLYSRAMLADKIDRFDILESDLLSIIEKDPNNAAALNALGYTLADRGERLEDAYNYIQRAYELSPRDFYILDSMGWVLYRLGRLDEAIDFLKKAIDLRNDPEVAAHLGEVYWVMGNEKAAKTVWETALKDTPADDRLLKVIKRFIP